MSGIVNAGFEDSNMDEGLENSEAYGTTGDDHYTHESGAPRFDTANGRIAIDAEEPGDNAAEEAAIQSHGDDSLILTDQDDDF